MSINQKAAQIVAEKGCTQKWLVNKMNAVYPGVQMDKNKMSGILNCKRTISGDEFLALCMALEVSPNVFLDL